LILGYVTLNVVIMLDEEGSLVWRPENARGRLITVIAIRPIAGAVMGLRVILARLLSEGSIPFASTKSYADVA